VGVSGVTHGASRRSPSDPHASGFEYRVTHRLDAGGFVWFFFFRVFFTGGIYRTVPFGP